METGKKFEPLNESYYQRNHRVLEACDVGVNAPRGCTDICCLFLFVACWALMIFTAIVAFGLGDINRLLYGVDYLGNICSRGKPVNVTAEAEAEWSTYGYLWYPVGFNYQTKEFILKDALKLGVCVPQCPLVGSEVTTYGTIAQSGAPAKWHVFFNSTTKFHRCYPNFLTFQCKSQQCYDVLNVTGALFDGMMEVAGALEEGLDELRDEWWIILVSAGITLVICFIWLVILRRLVKPMVVVTIILLVVALALLGYFLFVKSKDLEAENSKDDVYKYYFWGAILVWVVTFLIVCLIIFLFKDIMVACDIIEEASKIPVKMPTMFFVPPTLLLVLVPFAIFTIFVAAIIYTAAKPLTATLATPMSDPGSAVQYNITFKQYTFENWRVYAHIYNVFMFLWTMAFINAIGFMIVAFCAIFWYWSAPGDNKEPKSGVCSAVGFVLGHHLGTIAFGSFIIALVRLVRLLLALLENRMRDITQKNESAKFCLHCAQCCLAYFDRFVKFVNKNAYVVCSMTGESFLPAARHALTLLMRNVLSVGAVTVVGEYVMFFGKVLITACVVMSAYGICQKVGANTGHRYNVNFLLLITIAIMSYFITCIFLAIFGVCIDAVLLSYCYDLEHNNGADKPYYFPDDLAKHVDRAKERAQKTKAKKTKEMETPLN